MSEAADTVRGQLPGPRPRWLRIKSSLKQKRSKYFTKVKPPDLVDGLSVPLAAEDDHEVVDLDRGVGVEAAGAGPTADRMPAPSHWADKRF